MAQHGTAWRGKHIGVPMLQVSFQNKGLQHIELPMIIAHQLLLITISLPFGLPTMSHVHQAMIGIPVGFMNLLEGRLSET